MENVEKDSKRQIEDELMHKAVDYRLKAKACRSPRSCVSCIQ